MIYIIFDTETTGLNTNTDHIISFSYILTDFTKEYERGTIEMNPFATIEEARDEKYAKALEVNGYTPEKIMSFTPAKEAIKEVVKVFERAKGLNNGWWPKVMGYNVIAYDLPILRSNCERYGIEMPSTYPNAIDVLTMFVGLNEMGFMPRKVYTEGKQAGKEMGSKLCEAVERLGIESDPTKFHASMYDVEMTYELYMKIKQVLTIGL